MPYEHFAVLFMENFEFNLSIVFLTVITILLIYKKYIYSLFDPILFFLIFSSSGYSVVFILFFSGDIEFEYVLHFLLTQIALIVGFLLFKPINLVKIEQANSLFHLRISRDVKFIYYLSSFLYLLAHLILYMFKGIPLFMSSRLDATTGGFGFVSSISITTSIIVLSVLSYKFLLGLRFKFFDFLMSFMYICFSILSGSKSVFIGSAFIMFYVAYFIAVKMSIPAIIKIFNRAAMKIFFLAFIASVTTLFLISDENPLIKIIFRIIMTGDIYMMSYVDNNIELLEGNFFNLALPFRIVDILGLDQVRPIGNQLITIVYGTTANAGPNARHNVFGYVAFGYIGSILFSFCLGMIMGFIRNKLILLVKTNLRSLIFFSLIVSNVFTFEADFGLAVYNYISISLVYLIVYIFSYAVIYKKVNIYDK